MADDARGVMAIARVAHLRLHRRFQSRVDMPSLVDSRIDQTRAEPGSCSPLRNRERFAFARVQAIVPTVVALFLRRGPSTIRRLVVSVVIDAFKPIAFGPRTHVLAECLKGIAPSVTDFDSSASVAVKMFVVWVQATLADGFPDAIKARGGFGLLHIASLTHAD